MHNFIQARVAKFPSLPSTPKREFHVLVRNGEEISYSPICHKVPIALQNYSFDVDLYVMPLRGADAVLGVRWFRQLGPMLTDYEDLAMKFVWNGKIVTLVAGKPSIASKISLHQLKRVEAIESVVDSFI